MRRLAPKYLLALAGSVLALAGAACGGSPAPRAAPPPAAPAADPAAALAASLPPGANRCGVARPGGLSAVQRSLFLRLSQVHRLAWLGGPVVAWASAERVSPDGRRSLVALAEVSAEPEAVRAYFDTHAEARIAWGDAVEEGDAPRYRARFVGPRLLRIERGPWPIRQGEAEGAAARCAALALAFPDAVELSSRHGEVVVLGEFAHLPRHVDTVAMPARRGLRLVRRVHMASPAEAARREQDRWRGFGDDGFGGPSLGGSLLFDDLEQRREGAALVTRARVLWEDLFLVAEDRRRMAAAAREDERRQHPRPAAEVNVRNLAVVDHQRTLWRAELERARGQERTAIAVELARLLDRAFTQHPSRTDLARQRARLLLDELDRGAEAAELAERMISVEPAQGRVWREIRREALALEGPARLAEVLVTDGVVSTREAGRAAEELVRLRREGVDYGFAEGTWVAVRELRARARRMPLRPVAEATLSVESYLEAMVALLRMGRGDVQAAVYATMEGQGAPGEMSGWDPESAPVVELGGGEDTRRVAGVATVGDPRVRALGRALADGMQLGPVTLSLFVVPFDAGPERPLGTLRIEGTLDHDGLTLERAGGPAAQVDWRAVSRYLADPLAHLEPRVFPPPELTVDAEGSDEVRLLTRLAEDRGDVHCAVDGLQVRCAAAPEEPGAARALLMEFAARRLDRDARRLR